MLSGTAVTAKNTQQQSSAAGSSKSISPSSTSPSSNSIKNIKSEPYSGLSPLNGMSRNENADDTNLIEENSNNNNKNSSTIKLEPLGRENTASRTGMLRQNSSGSVNAAASGSAASPANGSDHSNSSNNSANIQAIENTPDMLQDLNNDKGPKKKLHSSEDDSGKSSSNEKIPKSLKDESDALKNLVNLKKEEGTTSPVMSPVGFGSIGNIATTPLECTGASGKLNDGQSVVGGNNTNEKVAPANQAGCADNVISGMNSASAEICGGSAVPHMQATPFPHNPSSGNSMEYTQQQNHIFVFSTQLANKGAESVINGHYPTIIAYHCTQPATKSFLEEFFMKNPMKVSKLHRQNIMCNMPNSQKWMGANKLSQKSNGNMNFPLNVDNKSNITNMRPHNMCGFGESSDTAVNNDLMLWEQTRNNMENPGIDMKLLEGVDSIVGNHNVGSNAHVPNKGIGLIDPADNSIPSLQGVKVPDENLTPQQRQHREEQLAKLKKMNQFLFPENGSEFRPDGTGLQAANALNKMGTDGMILNNPASAPNVTSPAIAANMRNIPPNLLGQNKVPHCSSENIGGLGEDAMLAVNDLLGAHDMPPMSCNLNKTPCNSNMVLHNQHSFPCSGTGGMTGIPSTIGNMQGNSGQCQGANTPGGILPNSPEIMGTFNQNSEGVQKAMASGVHSQDMHQPAMAQMEWSKLQNQFFEEKVKGKGHNTENPGMPNTMCRSNQANVNTNARSITNANCTPTGGNNNNQPGRLGQGPPPPYHSTQRSASVPIATESPNPSSPNNPTSNLSMPSPRTSGIVAGTANSPNLDLSATSVLSTSSAASVSTTITNTNSQIKGNFPMEGSPTNSNCGATNRSNRNNLNQFNSNPSTPLPRMSPKDIDSFHTTVPNGDPKNARPSPQRSRTPHMGPSTNSNLQDGTNIEGRFPSASPGLNFSPNNPASNATYKGPGTGAVERQNSAAGGPQFCRRSDNLPLNPNSNRMPPNKHIQSFDPISSLAQMSQQLTSCVTMNPGMGNNNSIGGNSVNDMNMSSNVNSNMDGMINSMDSGMDHCNPAASNMSMPPQHMNNSPFMGNNCHPMMGPMTQRLLNPKMCGSYNPGNNGREAPGNFHGMGPSHRMMSRMPINFGNFTPNIQVKASTPNTIQYMPVRPQNNNNNNMRVAPSLDFLQRYANPGAGGIIESGPGGVMSSDPNKMGQNANSGMNFFQNCNQIGGPIGIDQDEMLGHDLNMGGHNSMIRGMRPMRQHSMGPGGGGPSGPRMQGPNSHMAPQFTSSPPDSLECPDSNAMFNANNPTGGQGHMFNNAQQKQSKIMGPLAQGMNSATAPNSGQLPNANIMQNDHNNSIAPQNSSMMLNQNAMNVANNTSTALCNVGNGNAASYKPFVGSAPNDIKYSQQYLSFQQQLYATSTRNQQGAGNNIIGGNNPTSNSIFHK